MIHEFGWKSRIRLENVRRVAGMSVMRRHLRQIFVLVGQSAGEAALPAVDHRQRECPRAGRRPGDQRQRSPRQPLRHNGSPHHRSQTKQNRRARTPTDVGVDQPKIGAAAACQPKLSGAA